MTHLGKIIVPKGKRRIVEEIDESGLQDSGRHTIRHVCGINCRGVAFRRAVKVIM